MSNFSNLGTNLDSRFQVFSTGCLTASTTNFRNNNNDLRLRYAGRDNRGANSLGFNVNYSVNGNDLSKIFNKINSVFEYSISGSSTYNKQPKTPTLTYSPTNVVIPNCTSQTNAGTYNVNQFTIGTNIPTSYIKQANASSYTIFTASTDYTAPAYDGYDTGTNRYLYSFTLVSTIYTSDSYNCYVVNLSNPSIPCRWFNNDQTNLTVSSNGYYQLYIFDPTISGPYNIRIYLNYGIDGIGISNTNYNQIFFDI